MLDLHTLARACCVATHWRDGCCKLKNDWIWQAEFNRVFTDSTFLENAEQTGTTWRSLCYLQGRSRVGWLHGQVSRQQYQGHKDRVRHVRIRQDTVVSASWDHTLRVLNLEDETSQQVDDPQDAQQQQQDASATKQVVLHGGSVFGVVFDGRVAVTCSEDTTIKVWHVHQENRKTELIGHEKPVYRVAMISSEVLISCSRDFVGVWHWPSGTLQKQLFGHTHDVHRIQVSDSLIVTGSYDCTVRVWEYPSLNELWSSTSCHEKGLSSLHFEGNVLATGSGAGQVFVWDLAERGLKYEFDSSQHCEQTISCILVAGYRAFSTSSIGHLQHDGVVCIWDVRRGRLLQRLQESFFINALKKDFGFIFCACSDGYMRIRDPEGDQFDILREFQHGDRALYDVDVQGPRAVTCGLDTMVVVWTVDGVN
ncbi:F-box/WD repeat-containing protein 11 (F-box and WD repeats protein beta-TrCP2) (F-box/WD repeat-containing protein 1B) (Homologous to Slimb protein) (HOS) [Durusdinium trenchii]|uniref:F-box/WD repeat-containing protein 11 (F-box and WD repeats protein beta-TrCP2) (F-box/WD repeat-containing protein 1B) (Homologous to Slimb protein) (HOS) n=1 Tax=Durusdinium trenchii TaxID=1381693 RepID=A0ABP0LK66_9DINO